MPSPAHIRSTIAAITAPPEELRAVAAYHTALSDPTRLRLLQRLAGAPATVTELTEHVDLSQPLVSWHLGKLREVGLVTARRHGRETVHTIVPEAFVQFADRQARALNLADQTPVRQAIS